MNKLHTFYVFLENVLITFWVGSLWAIALIAAPALFEVLDSSADAGRVASYLFTRITWISMILGSALLCFGLILQPRWRARVAVGAITIILALMFMDFGVAEWMRTAREQTEDRATLLRLHGLAAGLYLIACLAGGVLLTRRREESVKT